MNDGGDGILKKKENEKTAIQMQYASWKFHANAELSTSIQFSTIGWSSTQTKKEDVLPVKELFLEN